MEFEAGQKFKAKIPFGDEPMKVHICYVLQSKAYRSRILIVYKVYGKHRQWWHELMCTAADMEYYIEDVKRYQTK